MDNMLNPNVPIDCQKIVHPKVTYDTAEKRMMDTRRADLTGVDDKKKQAILKNRLDIWGSVPATDADKFKNTAHSRTNSQIRVAAQISLMKSGTGFNK